MSLLPLSFSKLPDFLLESTILKISQIIKNGQSVQIVCPPGSGGTLLAKLISQKPEIISKYFGQKYFFVFINGEDLIEGSSLSLLRLFASSLTNKIDLIDDSLKLQEIVRSEISNTNEYKNIVIFIDQLDRLNGSKLTSFFEFLYSIHRVCEPKLNFIFRTNTKLEEVNKLKNYSYFSKVIVQNIIRNKPFSKKESMWFIGEKELQNNKKLPDLIKEEIFILTNGYPRTMKRFMEALSNGRTMEELKINPGCDIALSLHLEDLLKYKNDLPTIPILDIFIQRKEVPGKSGEAIEGIRLKDKLSKIEEKVFRLLITKEGKIVGRSEAIEKVWGGSALNISDHAYDQIIHRLKQKLVSSDPVVEIETVRGRGHVFKCKL